MENITIYFGPKSDFNKLIGYGTPAITLTSLAILSDKKMREHSFNLPGRKPATQSTTEKYEEPEKIRIPMLAAYSDEYASLSENAINGFLGFLSQFDISSVYLQNPPAYIVSQLSKSGQPLTALKYSYATVSHSSLKRISDSFSDTIIGQEAVKDRLLCSLYPLCSRKRSKPVTLLFYGPTGVGKTETAKFLSSVLGQPLFRRQFSMFNSSEFSSYLFGGKHSQACLSRDLLERESNIILFDEFDKPNPVFHSAFYQLFDEGIYEDKNYSAELKKSVIICTSNYSSEEEIRARLGAPIFSRFDDIIPYEPLSADAITEIIRKEFYQQIDNLEDWEKEITDCDTLLKHILSDTSLYTNVRQIKSSISRLLSHTLVKYVTSPAFS